MNSNMPTLRDPDSVLYFKEEVGGLVMGGYEQNPKMAPWDLRSVPANFVFLFLILIGFSLKV